MADQIDVQSPRIIRRKGRGYLAISPIGDRVQIGVTADTEADAVSKFTAAAAQWRALLAADPPNSAGGHTRI